MFDSITGKLIRKDPGGVVLSTHGIGYAVQIPLRTWNTLSPDSEITLYCHLAVKDDSMLLYGFPHPGERNLFRKIMSVSGIGAATALNILSEIPPRDFLDAISKENAALLQRVKKVGTRTAKRLILELKGKLEWDGLILEGQETGGISRARETSDTAGDLLAALMALGFSRAAAREGASKALAAHPGIDDLEPLIKSALQMM